MKKIALFLIGFSPMLIGFALNRLLAPSGLLRGFTQLWLVGLVMFALWFFAGRFSKKLVGSTPTAVALLNAAALLCLILLTYMEFVMGSYPPRLNMLAFTFFYRPFFYITAELSFVFSRFYYAS